MIHFTCACGRQLQAQENLAGQTAACPMCGRVQVVPAVADVCAAPMPVGQPSPVVVAVQPAAREAPFGSRESERARQSLMLGVFSLFGLSLLTGLPALVLGILALRDIRRSQGQQTGRWQAITGIITGSVGTVGIVLIVYGVRQVRQAAARSQVSNNLKQLTIGVVNYQDTYGRFPPAAFRGPAGPQPMTGPPLFSWRLGLMPWVEAGRIYSDFDKTTAWDSPANLPFLGSRPKVYALPDDKEPDPNGPCLPRSA